MDEVEKYRQVATAFKTLEAAEKTLKECKKEDTINTYEIIELDGHWVIGVYDETTFLGYI